MEKYDKIDHLKFDEIRKNFVNKLLNSNIPNNSIKLSNELLRRLLLVSFGETLSHSAGFSLHNDVLPILKKLDLSDFDWTNVVVSGIDFSDCNAVINPQVVHCKALKSGIYPLDFTEMCFDYCCIANSDFRGSIGVVYDLSRMPKYEKLGKKGFYPITFIGDVPNDSRFEGCKIVSQNDYYNNLLNNIYNEIDSCIKRTLKKETND